MGEFLLKSRVTHNSLPPCVEWAKTFPVNASKALVQNSNASAVQDDIFQRRFFQKFMPILLYV